VNRIRPVRRLTAWERAGVWLALALLAYLDSRGRVQATHADVFSWFLSALGFLEDVGNVIISGIEVALTTAVSWLVTAVTWIGGKIADIVLSTGSIFSKTWDALSSLWSDVIKPALSWIADAIKSFASWLHDFISPLLDWAKTVRDWVLEIYRDFVKPILDALAISKGILDILTALHVPFAATLDGYVQDLESWITKAYLEVLGKVNLVLNTINGLFTLDGLLQRFVLLRSVQRDIVFVQRALMNPSNRPLSDFDQAAQNARWQPQAPGDLQDALVDYVNGGTNDTGAAIDAAVQNAVDYWNAFDDSQAA
jgi:hypothetical protein